MENSSLQGETERQLARLEAQVETMLAVMSRLRKENRSLRAQQEQLIAERARLIEHSEQARTKVEAMVSRLKALEQGV
jgi:cell division protein ZapB